MKPCPVDAGRPLAALPLRAVMGTAIASSTVSHDSAQERGRIPAGNRPP